MFLSDHALAYFLNFYHIAVPDEQLQNIEFTANDEYRKKYKYQGLTKELGRGREGECSNERDRCKHDNLVCHYIEPTKMESLWKEAQLDKQRAGVRMAAVAQDGPTSNADGSSVSR